MKFPFFRLPSHQPPAPRTPLVTTQIPFSWKGAAVALVKAQNLHEGIFRVYFKFAILGANGTVNGHLYPMAMVPVMEVGLIRCTEMDELSVDAAVVNPEHRILMPAGIQ